MAKPQAKKKAAAPAKKPAKKAVSRVKVAVKAVKNAARKAVSKPKPAAKAAKPATKRPAPKAAAKPAPKKVLKKAAPKPAPKAAARKPLPKKAAPAPKKSVAKKATAKAVKAAAKVAKPIGKVLKKAARAVAKPLAKKPAKAAAVVPKAQPKVVAKPVKAPKAAKPAKPVKPSVAEVPVKAKAPAPVAAPPAVAPAAKTAAADDKKRTRRARPRILSNGTPVAAWLTPGEKPRPSSFIPAPARAEAPSLVAAPPASSDRLIRPEDVSSVAVRTVPVRVDIEQGGGRSFISVSPDEVTLRSGEGIEWDFRYLGGADVMADEIIIEFEKPSPFSQVTFRSRKPGPARPHRQLSGPAEQSASGQRLRYTIRVMTQFMTEFAMARPWVVVQP